ncbi:N2,N2-dimethylguanosine tRNA methyltransferase [Panus rudis PR-1116 ss-1]|nr:N2,N2-dimethylguanosine tRNA methyltransferase [Panus rudis PR-1116 ss-1]
MAQVEPSITVPEGFTLHTENSSHILLPNNNEAFLNPVQEFNRDLSVACIHTWGQIINEEKKKNWDAKQARKAENAHKLKRQKIDTAESAEKTEPIAETVAENGEEKPSAEDSPHSKQEYQPYHFVILEALSATGLRSIRYAKEIPSVKYVIANDLSPTAAAAMRRNVELNGLGEQTLPASSEDAQPKVRPAKVRVNEGDACALMYNHRSERDRVDVVDLDPYGTAAPFIDAAVQSIKDGGLLCVTCTDLSVLATANYPEKCYSNYGGLPVKAEYCHEAALRLVLHTISTSAARYGRYIQPLLSLSIDFYVRLWVRVATQANEVKRAVSKTSTYYVCSGCQAFYGQPLGRLTENIHPSGNVNIHVKAGVGPLVSNKCPECNSTMHVAGPMWSGPIHDPEFVSRVLGHVETNESKYGTAPRMKGMLTLAKDEFDTPFYFTPSRIAGTFHCTCPPLDDVASALLHAGHRVSRSHALAGSLKTDAPREVIHDIFRCWIKKHPVNKERISETSPAHHLLAKEPKTEANFKRHPNTVTAASKVHLVRYQQNPTPHWGPGTKANSGGKRKREQAE